MPSYEVRQLRPDEIEYAAMLYARAFRDQPTMIAAVGGETADRLRFIQRAMRLFLPRAGPLPLSAWKGGELVGALGVQGPGECRFTLGKMLRILPRAPFCGSLSAIPRLTRVLRDRDRHDLPEPHLHIEPLAVDPVANGRGVGAALFEHVIDRSEREGLPIFAIADRPRMTRFADPFGFEFVSEFESLGLRHIAGVRRVMGEGVTRRPSPGLVIGSS
jgi:GNAT superfamily N-acetyltransferase